MQKVFDDLRIPWKPLLTSLPRYSTSDFPVNTDLNFSFKHLVENVLNVKLEYIDKPLILTWDQKTDIPNFPKIIIKSLSSFFEQFFVRSCQVDSLYHFLNENLSLAMGFRRNLCFRSPD